MIDVNAQVDAVQRGVRTEEREGAALRVQTLVQEYGADLADVWSAVTEPDRIARWFLPPAGDLRLGGRYRLQGNAEGEVLECAPPAGDAAHYRVTWEYGGGVSWVTVRLAAIGDGRTRLELEHTARSADIPAEMWAQFGSSATGIGWDQGLLGLALYLGGARDGVTPEAAAEWLTTEDGKSFVRAAADRWAAADIADGADGDQSRAAATNTYLMYTGQLGG